MTSLLCSPTTRLAGPGTYFQTIPRSPTVATDDADKHDMKSDLASPGERTKRVRLSRWTRTPAQTKSRLFSPPLASARRTSHRRIDSTSTLISDKSSLHTGTPSPEALRSPAIAWPISPPGAPRIPFPPTPPLGHTSLAANRMPRNVGLGINMGNNNPNGTMDTFTYGEDNQGDMFDSFVFHPSFHMIEPRYTGARVSGLGITVDDQPLRTDSTSTVDDDTLVESEDDEEAYYHLPSNLLSPELIMSTEEFEDSLRRWIERRKDAPKKRRVKSDADIEEEEETLDFEEEQVSRRKSV
ncbi:hypothetical protein NM688_g7087 [Phlebia brevispora]|uniref:Uncharacterized protein n=1 Tax=Phlebia brevispora TaxID=194682 RepID=A0ACC1S9B0_9APHY|nr:hypothetical protein NM688_g7087 [Phlebia brevispora]